MPVTNAREFLPVELVFNPNWWYQTTGVSFEKPFYLDVETRTQNDVTMRRVLYEFSKELWLTDLKARLRQDAEAEGKNWDGGENDEYYEYYFDYIYVHSIYPK